MPELRVNLKLKKVIQYLYRWYNKNTHNKVECKEDPAPK